MVGCNFTVLWGVCVSTCGVGGAIENVCVYDRFIVTLVLVWLGRRLAMRIGGIAHAFLDVLNLPPSTLYPEFPP